MFRQTKCSISERTRHCFSCRGSGQCDAATQMLEMASAIRLWKGGDAWQQPAPDETIVGGTNVCADGTYSCAHEDLPI